MDKPPDLPSARWIQLGGHIDGTPRAWVLVDEEDYAFLIQWNWSYNRYAYRQVKQPDGRLRPLLMHRVIARATKGLEVDHINRDPLDNRKSNLRLVTHRQNHENRPRMIDGTARYRGVRKSRNRWTAFCHLNGTFHHLGQFDTQEEAAGVAAAFRAKHMPFATD